MRTLGPRLSQTVGQLLLSVMEEYADTEGSYKNCPHPTRPRPMELSPVSSDSHRGSLIPNVSKNHTPSEPFNLQTCRIN